MNSPCAAGSPPGRSDFTVSSVVSSTAPVSIAGSRARVRMCFNLSFMIFGLHRTIGSGQRFIVLFGKSFVRMFIFRQRYMAAEMRINQAAGRRLPFLAKPSGAANLFFRWHAKLRDRVGFDIPPKTAAHQPASRQSLHSLRFAYLPAQGCAPRPVLRQINRR